MYLPKVENRRSTDYEKKRQIMSYDIFTEKVRGLRTFFDGFPGLERRSFNGRLRFFSWSGIFDLKDILTVFTRERCSLYLTIFLRTMISRDFSSKFKFFVRCYEFSTQDWLKFWVFGGKLNAGQENTIRGKFKVKVATCYKIAATIFAKIIFLAS